MVSLREVGKQELGRKDTHSMEIQKRCSEISSVVTIPSKVEKKPAFYRVGMSNMPRFEKYIQGSISISFNFDKIPHISFTDFTL